MTDLEFYHYREELQKEINAAQRLLNRMNELQTPYAKVYTVAFCRTRYKEHSDEAAAIAAGEAALDEFDALRENDKKTT